MRQSSLILCLLCCAILAHAQTKETTKQAASRKSEARVSEASAGSEAEVKARRAKARSLLVALSSDARMFKDDTLRARALARIADALWAVDSEQGRLLMRKAWEAAEFADLENDKKLQEELNEQKARGGGSYAYNTPPNLRREVLRLAAQHDRSLGEEFLEKLRLQKLEAAASATTGPNPNRLNEAMSQRLSVARELLRTGETERALEFAAPALAVVAIESLNFLTELRAKDVAAADARYLALLTSAANNPQSDGNTASLLSAYVFTPNLYVTFSGNGISSSQSAEKIVPPDVTPELRNAYFQAAASMLLRPLPVPGQPDQSSTKLDGRYLVVKRLMPLFEQWAAPEITESLRGQLNALAAVVSENARRSDEEWLNKGIKPDKPAADREQKLLDQIDRAKTSAERDALYVDLGLTASRKGDVKARDFVAKIDDSELRKQAEAYVDASLAMQFVQKKLTDQALEIARKGELTHIQRIWVLTESAKLLAKPDRDKAAEIIDEAGLEARRIDVSDPDLPRSLFAIANALKVIDLPRAWDAAFDGVKAANSAEGFTGEDGQMVFRFLSKGQSSIHTSDVPEFNVDGIFRDLAALDYDRAVELARGFQGEGPRAVATIAIARAILEPTRR